MVKRGHWDVLVIGVATGGVRPGSIQIHHCQVVRRRGRGIYAGRYSLGTSLVHAYDAMCKGVHTGVQPFCTPAPVRACLDSKSEYAGRERKQAHDKEK